jgi:hypothetical protein
LCASAAFGPDPTSQQVLQHVGELVQLRELELLIPSLTDADLARLSGLTQLKHLEIRGNRNITNEALRHFAAMQQLELLRLTGTGIDTAGLLHVAQHRRLKVLDLADTSLDDEDLREIGKLADLRQLGLAGTRLNGSGLVQLAGLKYLVALNLTRTAVGDEDILAIAKLRSLKRVAVGNTMITAAGRGQLKEMLPGCYVTGP